MSQHQSGGGGIEKILLLGGIAFAGYYIWETFFGTAAAPVAAAPPAGTAPVSTTPAPAASPSALDAAYIALQAAVKAHATDPAIQLVGGQYVATPDVFNYYLTHMASTPIATGPDPGVAFGGNDSAITLAQYWAGVAPWAKATLGLSGLGHFGNLGAMARRYR